MRPLAPRSLTLLAVVLAAGCGDRLVGGSYPGEPLGTLSGSMVLAPETELAGPVRLALAWYPRWLSAEEPSGGGPGPAIVTEEVEAEGTFPVAFRFPVYRPPPATALAPLGGGLEGRGAFGVLLAYEDLDGDRRLGVIPEAGAPVDRILGASILGDPRAAFALVYVDRPQPAATGLAPGFNLVKAVNDEAAEVVPLDTRVRLSLTAGGPLYDAFACAAGWLTFLVAPVCGLSLPDEAGPPGFGFDGTVRLDGTRLEVELTVTSLGATYPEANVNVNGRVIPWDPGRGAFVLVEDGSTLVRPGSSFPIAVAAAGASRGAVFTMPGDFQLETPAEGAAVSRSAPLELRWTASAGTTTYYGGFDAATGGNSTITPSPEVRFLELDTRWVQEVGPATAFVEARVEADDGRAYVTAALVRRRAFWFTD